MVLQCFWNLYILYIRYIPKSLQEPVVQNKTLMGLIFWTSWRVVPQKFRNRLEKSVFCFLYLNFSFCGAGCSFWVKNCKILRFLRKPCKKSRVTQAFSASSLPHASTPSPLVVKGSEWSEVSEVKWVSEWVNPKRSFKFDETYICYRTCSNLNRYTSSLCKTKVLWV